MQVLSENILDEKVSYQDGVLSSIKCELSIRESLKRIKEGNYNSQVALLRGFLSKNNKQKYDENKKKLPCICFCGTFNERRVKENLKKYNHLIVIDIDKLDANEVQRLKACFMTDDFVYSFWESPSGGGLKGIVALNYEFDLSKHDVNEIHKFAFIKLTQYFKEKYSIELDVSGSDITRLCFFSSDPNLHCKSSIKYFSILETDLSKPKVKKAKVRNSKKKISQGVTVSADCLMNPTDKNRPQDRFRIQSILKYLSKRNRSITNSYDNWFRVALAIANTFTHDIGEKYYLRLCKLDGAKHNEQASKDMLKNCYVKTRNEIGFNTIFHFAKQHGYKAEGEGSTEDG